MNRLLLLAIVLLMGLASASSLVAFCSPGTAAPAAAAQGERVLGGGGAQGGRTSLALPVRPVTPEQSPQPAAVPLAQPQTGPAARKRANQALRNLPLRFIANAGQNDPAARFTVKGEGHTLFFTPEEVVFSAVQEVEERPVRSVVRLRFQGASPTPAIVGLAPMQGVVNLFVGSDPAHWRANVPTYGAVAYRSLYPGIDLVYRGSQGHLKSEFHVAPGGDPADIVMAYSGLEELYLRQDGAVVLETALGELVEEAPLIYQEVDGVRRRIPGRYVPLSPPEGEVWRGERVYRLRFDVAAYEASRPLVIDPALSYSTYVGGGSNDYGQDIAVDSAGNIYITGYTYSTDFPLFAEMQTDKDYADAFVTHLINVSGVYTYGYSTYLGGNDVDNAHGIAVDDSGDAYVTGHTGSDDFPTRNPVQAAHGGGTFDAFVTHIISASGSYTLAYSTYLGGNGIDYGRDIAVNGAGDAYVTGYTLSSDFPTTSNAIQADQGGADAFVTQIDDAGGTYVYSSYLGGGGRDWGAGIAVNGTGDAYVTGYTSSSDFPTQNAIQPSRRGLDDAFVTQIIETGGIYTYAYSTYLGGQSADEANDIAVDSAGSAYVTGYTISSDFPTHRAIQPGRAGGYDAFVTQIISASEVYTYAYSTYLGGGDEDRGAGIAVDDKGNAYLTGLTYSDDFPTRHPLQADQGTFDAFVTQIVSASEVYTYGYSTYLGGGGGDRGQDVAVDDSGNAYVTGYTVSDDFPARQATQPYQGSSDAFVTVIAGPADLAITKSVTPSVAPCGGTVTYTVVYTNEGLATVAGIVITDVVPITLTHVNVDRSGALITPTGSVSFGWEVEPLSPAAGGVITISGVVDPAASGVFSLTNQATITTTDLYYVETILENNTSAVSHTVDAEPPLPPNLVSPANGVLLGDATPTLIWQASPGPDVAGYLLDWNSTLVDAGNATQYTAGVLPDGVYTWTVAAYDAVGNTSTYTDVWSLAVDSTAPEVVDTTPADGAVGVAVEAAVVITFSEGIEAGSLDYTVSPDPGGWSASWGSGGAAVTLVHNPFASGTTYTVSVTTASDLVGNPLAGAPVAWQFTTAKYSVYVPLVLR